MVFRNHIQDEVRKMKISVKVGNTYYEAFDITELPKNIDLDVVKQAIIDQILKPQYQKLIASTDDRILQYQKRQALGILNEDDETDYQEALAEYKKWTEWYKQKKQEIENAESIEELSSIVFEP